MVHVRHINPAKIHPERIMCKGKKLAKNLDQDEIEFLVREKDFSKIETKNNICINVFCYENSLTFPIYFSNQKFKYAIDLLLVNDGDKSHYVHIKDFNRLSFTKQRIKTKNTFVRIVYSVLVVKMC